MSLLPEHSIIIAPVGDLDEFLIERAERAINRMFGYPTEILPLLPDVDFAFHADRSQYHSTPILEKLTAQAPVHTAKIIAIVDVDLYIPILTHVYGEAQLGGKAAVVSVHRLKQDLFPPDSRKSCRHRVLKEAIHELGHTFSLRHCRDHTCIMHYCRTLRDVDTKSDRFCRYCDILLKDEIKRLAEEGGSIKDERPIPLTAGNVQSRL
ncbi:MAG: archaemetzincin family Zn-dependent metalloprotease [Deltaproteobacteria bacterium]|nr:archaemetzincin family Zn-dependent metalloprotease [Deltaproteobacteria bacterium]